MVEKLIGVGESLGTCIVDGVQVEGTKEQVLRWIAVASVL